jgi:hypothetical protein
VKLAGVVILVVGREEASFERDGERVEGGFPSVHPPVGAFAGRVERAHDEVEALERGLLVREVPTRGTVRNFV